MTCERLKLTVKWSEGIQLLSGSTMTLVTQLESNRSRIFMCWLHGLLVGIGSCQRQSCKKNLNGN